MGSRMEKREQGAPQRRRRRAEPLPCSVFEWWPGLSTGSLVSERIHTFDAQGQEGRQTRWPAALVAAGPGTHGSPLLGASIFSVKEEEPPCCWGTCSGLEENVGEAGVWLVAPPGETSPRRAPATPSQAPGFTHANLGM